MSAPTEVWSCGGGTQSGAIAELIRLGKLPKPDFAFMTDTGRERSSTWPFVDGFIRPALASVGLDLTIVKAVDFANTEIFSGDTILLPGYTTQNGAIGKLSPFCSGKWKRDVAERWMRSVGIKTCRNWIGISRDETRRLRTQYRAWLELWYPLVFEVPMSREDCRRLIRKAGWTGKIPHSSCFMCPNLSDLEWSDQRQNSPADFEKACRIDEDSRALDPHFYLHPSCVPLRQVDFDAQATMFPERGCTTGCFT